MVIHDVAVMKKRGWRKAAVSTAAAESRRERRASVNEENRGG